MTELDCLFCKIVAGKIPCRKVFETENTLAFLDISPLSEGHTVVISKKHYINLLDFPEDEIPSFFSDLKATAKLVKDKLHVEGFNILQNNFPVAGQVIPHIHFHILPRYKGINFAKITKNPAYASNEALDDIYNKIK